MNIRLSMFVAGALCLGACSIERYEDCSRDDDGYVDDFEMGHRAGSSSRAGSSAGHGGSTSGSDAGGGTTGELTGGAGGEPSETTAIPCERERDCDAGFNCNFDAHECQASDTETCGEMENEAECAARSDCIAVYGGINCSCGADCACEGGEPGCICESFDYLVCQPAE